MAPGLKCFRQAVSGVNFDSFPIPPYKSNSPPTNYSFTFIFYLSNPFLKTYKQAENMGCDGRILMSEVFRKRQERYLIHIY